MTAQRLFAILSAGLLSMLVAADLHAEEPKGVTIRLNRKGADDLKATFDVAGLPSEDLAAPAKAHLEPTQWTALFAVRVLSGTATDEMPPLLGSYRVEDGLLRFEPRFPLTTGLRYRAVFHPDQLPGHGKKEKEIAAEFDLPRPIVKPTTVVQQVYPTRNKLPENQLKFYFHFSAPMSRGDSYKHIQLLDAAGKPVAVPFLELDQELWDRESRRFTLLFDPGRIKRGLKSREEAGPAIEEGKSYTLVIDAAWTDAQGNPLKESFRKKFTVGPPDDQPPDPKTWKLQAPAAGKNEPLTVVFPKPMEHALLHRLLWVVDGDGRKVSGTITVTDEETQWHFTPEKAWTAGSYQLVADTALEDLSGNSIGKPFEIDVFRPVQREIKSETVQLPFQVKP